MRFRACQANDGSNSNNCSDSSVEFGTCNNGPCPFWSDWSSWGDCSAECDGGLQSRNRQCQNGNENDCPGPSTDEKQCNQESCDTNGMLYWEDHFLPTGYSQGWKQIYSEYLPSGEVPSGETIHDQCLSYCLSFDGCIAASSIHYEAFDQPERDTEGFTVLRCLITDTGPLKPSAPTPEEWRFVEGVSQEKRMFYVAEDYYEANPFIFNYTADGYTGGGQVKTEGLCDETNSDFGMVYYQNFDGNAFTAFEDKNIVRVPGFTGNCAAQCFGIAGYWNMASNNGYCASSNNTRSNNHNCSIKLRYQMAIIVG